MQESRGNNYPLPEKSNSHRFVNTAGQQSHILISLLHCICALNLQTYTCKGLMRLVLRNYINNLDTKVEICTHDRN